MDDNPMNLMTAFPTMVGGQQFPDTTALNADLRRYIHEKKKADPEGVYRSNSSGTWHSDDKLFSWAGEAGKKLQEMFLYSYTTYAKHVFKVQDNYELRIRPAAWAMIYTDGGYSTVHTHPNCHLSAVYYLDGGCDAERTMATGVKVRAGDIEFVNPGHPAHFQFDGMNSQPGFKITPDPGLMLVFPSDLHHFVHPFVGEGERISIACNAIIQPVKKETEHDPDR